jgi:hypothetical protein
MRQNYRVLDDSKKDRPDPEIVEVDTYQDLQHNSTRDQYGKKGKSSTVQACSHTT